MNLGEKVSSYVPAPASSNRGVYFLANDAVLELAIAFLTSFREYNPSIPLCLIPFDSSVEGLSCMQGKFGFSVWQDDEILSRCDDIGVSFHGCVRGQYRKLAMWSGPFDEFIYIDTDTVVLESVDFVFALLSQFGFVTSHSHRPFLRKWVWKDSIFESRQLSLEQIVYSANTGFIASRKGNLSVEEACTKLPAALAVAPHMELLCVEQPLLNYLIVTSGLKYTSLYMVFQSNPLGGIALERWAGETLEWGADGRILFPKFPRTLLVHWAGQWQKARLNGEPVSNRKLWECYRYR